MAIPSKSSERLSLAGLVAALLYAFVSYYLGAVRGGYALRGLAVFAMMAGGVALLSLFHAMLQRQAAEEEREAEAQPGESSIFAPGEATLVKTRNLRQFEKYFGPGATLLLALLEFVLGYYLFRLAARQSLPPPQESALAVAAVVFVGALVFYLGGSYIAGLAFGPSPTRVDSGSSSGPTVLRALAGELLGLAWLSALAGLAGLLRLSQLPSYDALLAQILAGLLMLRGLEKILTVVMEVYRPRRAGAAARLVYESRLNGLLAQPKGLLKNLAETLNYQFGISISEAGFAKLAIVVPLVLLFHLLVLGLFSCFVFINSGEQALRERWGRPYPDPERAVLNPGFHLKLPWPIDKVYREPVAKVRQLRLGLAGLPDRKAGLWTEEAAAQPELFVTPTTVSGDDVSPGGGKNLLAAGIVLEFKIADLRQYLYTSGEPDKLLEIIARREIVRYFAGHDLLAILWHDSQQVAPAPRQDGRELAQALRSLVQQAADERRLGLEVLYLGIRRIQPPAPVVQVFREVIAAGEERCKELLKAKGGKDALLTRAFTESEQALSQAHSYRANRVRLSRAEAENFTRLLELYQRHRVIYRTRAYLDRIEKLKNVRKLVLATAIDDQVITLDLKKSKSELFEFAEENEND